MKLAGPALAFLLAQSIEPVQEPVWQPDPHVCTTNCAHVEKDTPEVKGCACPASRGEGCDRDGNRTTHVMTGCVNGKDCLAKCCKCCPLD